MASPCSATMKMPTHALCHSTRPCLNEIISVINAFAMNRVAVRKFFVRAIGMEGSLYFAMGMMVWRISLSIN